MGSHQHILSLRHGDIKDKKRLFALLSGQAVEMPTTSIEESIEEGEKAKDREE